MKRKIIIGTLIVAGATVGCSSDDETLQPPIGFVQVFGDEFTGALGESPDPSKWTYDIGTGPNDSGWGNNELQYYTDDPENVSLDGDGNLVITARDVPVADRGSFGNRAYSSARIKTQGLFEQEYGLFEARIRLPSGQGMWPAFWMLGDDIDEVGWPRTGEIDIMEFNGGEATATSGALHGPGHNGANAIFAKYEERVDVEVVNDQGETEIETELREFDEEFHVFAVEWDPSRITWSVDGNVFFIQNSAQVQAAAETNCEGDLIAGGCDAFSTRDRWPYDHPFFMLLNLAVGGTFVQNQAPLPGSLPQTLLIDYVRVFERAR
ncbi:MAG: glycoside hydrolase family 16 protein [Myxococcota bacterium]